MKTWMAEVASGIESLRLLKADSSHTVRRLETKYCNKDLNEALTVSNIHGLILLSHSCQSRVTLLNSRVTAV